MGYLHSMQRGGFQVSHSDEVGACVRKDGFLSPFKYMLRRGPDLLLCLNNTTFTKIKLSHNVV